MKRIGKYLYVVKLERPTHRKTDRWAIYGNYDNYLGLVQWHPPWRQYTFDPGTGTIWNSTCLDDVSNFLKMINLQHRRSNMKGKGSTVGDLMKHAGEPIPDELKRALKRAAEDF